MVALVIWASIFVWEVQKAFAPDHSVDGGLGGVTESIVENLSIHSCGDFWVILIS